MFENRVLRRIFGPKREEVAGGWISLHNEELRKLYASPDIIRATESRKMRWTGHVARVGETSNAYKILVEKPEGKRRLGRPTRRWGIILEWILGKQGGKVWTGCIWLRRGTSGGLF
jgi:hypothetical protein